MAEVQGKTNLSRGEDEVVVEPRESWLTTVAGVAGNVLEWYDFAVFGYFSDIIAQVFFPAVEGDTGNETNLIRTFCIFGSAFIMRPFGGLLIGYIGDKHGRRTALTRSLLLMAIPTTLMGCLPTYESVGTLSIVLLVLCRLVQGLSVGGQLPASLVYTVEKQDPKHWGYYGSLPMVAANVGTLLGNLCGALLREFLTEDQLLEWGWRLPFFSGFLIAFVACYLRSYGKEVHTTAGVYDQDTSQHNNPISVALSKGNWLALLSTSLTPMLWAAGFYVTFVWIAIFMEELMDPPVQNGFWINAASLLIGMTFMLPIAGAISDRTGRIIMMTVSGLLLAGLGPILWILIAKGKGMLTFLCQVALGVLLSFFGAPLCAWLVENFPPEVRITSASLGYDISHAIVGGFSPAMASALYVHVGSRAPGLIYLIFGVLSVAGIYVAYCCGGYPKEDIQPADDLELSETNTAKKGELPEVA
eukprot:Nitzschia sp. Nitz4//scaffold142_size57810//36328//37979//NITZ4_006499-RA/size57810-processed-gene-0.7-mRNA-1//1//CDS//3329536400//8843//frame0